MAHAGPSFAQEPEAREFLDLITTMMCDAMNKSWVLRNNHTFLSIRIDVRWQPEGGQAKSEAYGLALHKGPMPYCANLHLPVMDGRGVASAFSDYLAKPITPETFVRQIETLSSASDLRIRHDV